MATDSLEWICALSQAHTRACTQSTHPEQAWGLPSMQAQAGSQVLSGTWDHTDVCNHTHEFPGHQASLSYVHTRASRVAGFILTCAHTWARGIRFIH